MMLLSRNEFREGVFARDSHQCVICRAPGADAHHIMERRLFDDGGYYLDNGATLCGEHHLLAEATVLTCEEIRQAAGITQVVLPSHLYPDDRYDKWGNSFLPSGKRMRGELFYDESVQKILGSIQSEFLRYVKYPRTWHLPWSPGRTADDRVLTDFSQFENQDVVVTTKMDGECTTFYSDYLHARSIDGRNHPSRNWVKNLQAKVGWEIPEGWRVCGENLFATHSIKYNDLSSYFLVFSIWNEKNRCLSWDDTLECCELLGLVTVPVLYRGKWNLGLIQALYPDKLPGHEGYVVRLSSEFGFAAFRRSVAKFVRASHVSTHGHWMHGLIEKNGLTDVPTGHQE